MNQTPEELLLEKDSRVDYSRSQRRKAEKNTHREETKKTKVPLVHKFHIAFFSILTACLTVALPFFSDLANSLQSQNIYTGMMMTSGQLPFSDIFATGGFLYYVLIAIGYYLGTSLWLVLVTFLATYVSGIYLYKIFNYFTNSTKISAAANTIFYLLNIALGFGGLYPSQWAIPFVLVSLWFLVKYFAGIIKDEAFILYGFAGAAAMLLDPRTLVFWALSFLTIGVYNIGKKHVARGFYQLLCIIFGTILVFYTAGFFILNLQILLPYLKQAVVYPFTFFAAGKENFLLGIAFQMFAALASGLLLGFFTFLKHISKGEDKVAKWLIFLTAIVYLVIACLSQDFHLYHLLNFLPFGLVLSVLGLNHYYQSSRSKSAHRSKKSGREGARFFELYLERHLYLPIFVFLVSIGLSAFHYVSSLDINAQRSTVATYLSSQVASDDKVYVWDDSAKIYIDGQLKSSAEFPLPSVNTMKKSQAKLLEDELLQNKSAFVVVNNKEKISETIENNLKANYDQLSVDGVSSFTIYKKK